MKELRVYVIDVTNFEGNVNRIKNEEFISTAEEQGNVYTLDKFTTDYNSGELNQNRTIIRFIEVEIPTEDKSI